jgi:hypothetical protein
LRLATPLPPARTGNNQGACPTPIIKVGYGKPPRHTRFKKGEPSANPRGRPRKNLAALLIEGLTKPVTVTENGRRKATVREAVVSQLINKSANSGSARHQDAARHHARCREASLACPAARGAATLHTGR